ncbi:hypothetical protein E2C01_071833 [Portunus trituberculatus]|uniref:Uncharacterized protein n=1 Tax=Portunus trituberculatus TaxID=210409 RepID=A0A5B7HWB3_PORTR|nr:hypothetical protein [Portunus trituberculatus]
MQCRFDLFDIRDCGFEHEYHDASSDTYTQTSNLTKHPTLLQPIQEQKWHDVSLCPQRLIFTPDELTGIREALRLYAPLHLRMTDGDKLEDISGLILARLLLIAPGSHHCSVPATHPSLPHSSTAFRV